MFSGVNLLEMDTQIKQEQLAVLAGEDYDVAVLTDYTNAELVKYEVQYGVYKIPVGDSFVIMKTSADVYDDESKDAILNEAFVGLCGLNSLNSPHFVRVLGAKLNATCIRDDDVFDYDEPDAPRCHYVIYEYVAGMSLGDYLFGVRVETMVSLLRQIFGALHQAYTAIDFTHYDLHAGNIIIKADGTPVILDYGRSHIKYGGDDFGPGTVGPMDVDHRSMWFHDVFMLLIVLAKVYDYDNARINVTHRLNEILGGVIYSIDEGARLQHSGIEVFSNFDKEFYTPAQLESKLLEKQQKARMALPERLQRKQELETALLNPQVPELDYSLGLMLFDLIQYFQPDVVINTEWLRSDLLKYNFPTPEMVINWNHYRFNTFIAHAEAVFERYMLSAI